MTRVRVSPGVQQGLLINKVNPLYPPLARQANIEGVVTLSAEIGKDGTIENLRLVSGHPLLANAAMDAVKQWRYKAATLNGTPIESTVQVNMNFQPPR